MSHFYTPCFIPFSASAIPTPLFIFNVFFYFNNMGEPTIFSFEFDQVWTPARDDDGDSEEITMTEKSVDLPPLEEI